MAQSQYILLVEDQPMVAFMLQDILEAAGYAVIVVHSGNDARAEIAARPDAIAVVITDIQLVSRNDGWALAEYARASNPGVQIVYMSGTSDQAHRAMGVANSVFLNKPFNSRQLIAAVAPLVKAS